MERPELILIHNNKNKKHKICRKLIKVKYPQSSNFLWKLWITFKGWFK